MPLVLLTPSVMAKIPASDAPAMKMVGSWDSLKKLIAAVLVAGSRGVIRCAVVTTLDAAGQRKLEFPTEVTKVFGEIVHRPRKTLLFCRGRTNAIASVVAVLGDAGDTPMLAKMIVG